MLILHFDEITSTNDYVKENAGTLTLPCLVTARQQTKGRGRGEKSFYSPKDTGVYFTLIFRAKENFDFITPAAAVCVCREIKKLTGIETQIKWVNDIFLDSKKIGGILSERFSVKGESLTAVGIGINLTTNDFPAELPLASSLGKEVDKNQLSLSVVNSLLEINKKPNREEIFTEYSNRLFIVGKTVSFALNGKIFRGKAVGINEDFNLLVDCEGEIFTLSSGEISIRTE